MEFLNYINYSYSIKLSNIFYKSQILSNIKIFSLYLFIKKYSNRDTECIPVLYKLVTGIQ